MNANMRVPVYESSHGDCPYLPDRTWVTHSFRAELVDEDFYEKLLGQGWRRSGGLYYQNHCPGCRLCIPIRISVEDFAPTRSQRRVLRRNADVEISVGPMRLAGGKVGLGNESGTSEREFQELYELYARYSTEWHDADAVPTEEDFLDFLAASPLESLVMRYRIGGSLVGAGWLDVLPGGLSSVYFAFDPDQAKRSLGTFSLMKEVERAATLDKPWLYVGFWVPGSRKMAYKANFHPHQILLDGIWQDEAASPDSAPDAVV